MRRFWIALPIAAGLAVGTGAAVLMASPTELEAEIADMGSVNRATRASGITRFKARGVVTALQYLEADPAPLLRSSLVEVVREVGPSAQVVPALRRLLASADPGDRMAAIHAVTGQPSLLRPELKALLANDRQHGAVRKAAAAALGGDGAQSRSDLLAVAGDAAEAKDVRLAAIRALAVTGTTGAADVRAIAQDADEPKSVRIAAIQALGAAGSHCRSALSTLTQDTTAYVREYAVSALGTIGNANDVDAVAGLSGSDGAASVRLAALVALIDMGAESSKASAIAARLGDSDVRIQARAAESLARSTGVAYEDVDDALSGLLSSSSFLVRYQAALAMHAYGDDGGTSTMQSDAASGPADQQKLAQRALSVLAGQ